MVGWLAGGREDSPFGLLHTRLAARDGSRLAVGPRREERMVARALTAASAATGGECALPRPSIGNGRVVGVIAALTTATQLRAAGPLGLGELLLAGWIFLSLYRMSKTPRLDRPKHPLESFWNIVVPVFLLGPIWATAFGRRSPTMPRDLVAMGLMAVFSMVAVNVLDANERERTIMAYAYTVAAVFTILFVAEPLAGAAGINTRYFGRFVGWAENPNQVAIDLVWVPFLLWRSFRRQSSHRWVTGGLFLGAVYVGWACDSQALQVGWMAAAVVIGGRAIFSGDRGPYARQFATAGAALALGLGLFYAPSIAGSIGSYGDSLRYQQGSDDGGGRGRLQRHAIVAWTYSPVIGFGPGMYSGLARPFQDEEAHNSILDLLMKAGAIGAIALVVLCRRCWRRAVADGWPSVGALVALIAFSTSHNALRHPAVWILFLFLGGLGARSGDADPIEAPVGKYVR